MPVKVFMIVPDVSDPSQARLRWEQAEQALNSAGDGFAIERITQNAVLSLGKSISLRENIFVVATFSGRAFEHVLSLGCRIFGAPCMLQCIENRNPLPRRCQAVYAHALRDVLVCCSGLDREKKDYIYRVVKWLGGDYTLDLTADVTHLIANKVGSPKYFAFIRLNKPIVTTAWIENVWQIAQSSYPLPEDLITSGSKFSLPIFTGLIICSSGFREDERRYFKQSAEKHGGSFTGQLRQNECTHLIVRDLQGDKYEAAKQWGNVKIVAASWLIESVIAGCCLPEENYIIHGPRPPKSSEIVKPAPELEPPKQITQQNLGSFLTSCCIYLHKQAPQVIDELKCLINSAGGMCVMEPMDMVTHVVASIQDLESAQDLVHAYCSLATIVSADWVRQCSAASELLDESKYDLTKLKEIETKIASQNVSSEPPPNEVAEASVMEATIFENKSFMSHSIVADTSEYRKIGLDGFKPKSERFNDVISTLRKFHCECVTVGPTTSETLDLLIVPFGQELSVGGARVFQSGVKTVNSLFLEVLKVCWDRFAKQHRYSMPKTVSITEVIPKIDSHLSNPILTTIHPVVPCLENCCITLTGFEQPERTLLVRLIIALGGAHQELFARTAQATNQNSSKQLQLQRSTHLVAAKASGEKFEKAKHWQVPVLKKDWLLDCWKNSQRLPEANYEMVSTFNSTLNETVCDRSTLDISTRKAEQIGVEEPKAEPNISQKSDTDEKSLISKRLEAVLAASRSDSNVLRRGRSSPLKTPKTPSAGVADSQFIAPIRPTTQPVMYGLESSQSVQVVWGDDSATNRYSIGSDSRLDDEPPSKIKSLTLIEDAVSSPNTSLLVNPDSSSHTKANHFIANCNSNSEPAVARAPDAVVVAHRSSSFANNHKSSELAHHSENITRSRLRTPVFQFTGLQACERDDAAALLERIGAKVITQPVMTMTEGVGSSLSDAPIEASCTHVIVAEPCRSQKFLSGIASGKWMLHRSYIDACRIENRLVDESPFEWGSERCADPPATACKGDKDLARRLAKSAHRWRISLSSTGHGAFADWRVHLLVFNPQVEQSCRQILVSGGATVLSLPTDFSLPPAHSFTHWLVDPNIYQQLSTGLQTSTSTTAKTARLQQLRKAYDCLHRFLTVCGGPQAPNGGGAVIRHDYLQTYLLLDPIPPVRQSLLSASSLPPLSQSISSPARRMGSNSVQNSANSGESFAHSDKRMRMGTSSGLLK